MLDLSGALSLGLSLFFPFFVLREHINFHWCGFFPVCHACTTVCTLGECLPLNSESIVPLQSCRVQSNVPAPLWILWVVRQYRCFDRVLKRV